MKADEAAMALVGINLIPSISGYPEDQPGAATNSLSCVIPEEADSMHFSW